ncbi:MAG: hypothetical protein ACI835_005899, partial [Planctomycetota bacterium]
MGQYIKDFANWFAEPTRYTITTTLMLFATLKWRRVLTKPIVFIATMGLGVAFFVFAWDDKNFNTI